jgi:diguanylate cyclase (GGDEF)-like protein/PAS domain S-box-containing protein
VEAEGVVHSVRQSQHSVTLAIALTDGMIQAVAPLEENADYARTIDSKVVVRGNAAPLFNQNRQMIGARLLFPSLAELRIEEPSPRDPFSAPRRPISGLLRFAPNLTFVHRVHVSGIVTLQWPGRRLVVQDDNQALFVSTVETTPLSPGDRVEVDGFPALGEYAGTLEDAVFKRVGTGQVVDAATVTAQEAMKGDYDARLIRIRGKLVNRDSTAENPTLVLVSQGTFFMAALPSGTKAGELASWPAGSELQLDGVCSVQVDKYQSAQREGAAQPKSFRVLLRSPRDVSVIQWPSWWTTGRMLGVLAICILTILVGTLWVALLKRRVEERTETIRATLESTAEGILVMDSAGRVVEHNQKFAAMWGRPEEAFRALDYRRLLDIVESQLMNPGAFAYQWEMAHANTKTDDVIELKDGRIFERHSEPQTVKGKNVGRVWVFRDVTEVRKQTRELEELARSDGLTGLLNRRAIFEFLSSELARDRSSGCGTAVIMADLDGFKKINDRYGHAAGDAVLIETAWRLKSSCRGSDVVGRYGGEEFLIVLPGCDGRSAESRAEDFKQAIERDPVFAGEREMAVTCSFGVAWTGDDTYGMRHLLQAADAALYRAKRAGRSCIVMANADDEAAILSAR